MTLYRRFVSWAFDRFYREFSWTYDPVAWLVSRGLWWRWILAVLPFLQGRVLELGFGPGYLQLACVDHHPIFGLDASPHMVARASASLRRVGKPVRLLRGLSQSLPFATASFDTVVATFPASYILDPDTHSEIRRVLAPGGRMVILGASRFTRDGLYERLVDLAYKITFESSVRRSADPRPLLPQVPGFNLRTEQVAVGPSEALILIGTRLSE